MINREIIKKCIAGNRQSQEQLYQQYAGTMLGVCYRYTKSMEDAEDVLQEGFIKVFTRLDQFKNTGDLGAWIRRIMVNTAITYLTRHTRYKRELLSEDQTLHPVSDDNPQLSLQMKELIEMIRELPCNYQTVFNLVAVEGFNHVDVAEMLQMNENTVRSQYSRARSMLIAILKKNELAKEQKNYADRF